MVNIKKLTARMIIFICNLLPLKKNKVFMFNYYGSGYGCNPKYISDFLLNNYPGGQFDIVWAFYDSTDNSYPDSIRKVKTMSIRYFYELCTSKVVITNFRTTDFFVKRKNQYYIQTWHSSLRLKQIERDAENVLPVNYVKMAKRDSLKCDLLLSGCKYSTDIFKKSFWYDGEIFEHGTPRNDLLFKNDLELKKTVKRKLNVPTESKVLLYAPTFRKDNDLSVYDLNYSRLCEKLKSRFGGDWIVLVKLHPHLMSKADQSPPGVNVFDVTDYEDIQELLLIADVLITDYSSLMFDFSITKRPCFLYVPDLEEYTNKDRKLYFQLNELPFINAVSNDELFDKLEQFDKAGYHGNLKEFLTKIGSFEKGRAAEHLTHRLEDICFGKRRGEMDEAV